jgi:2-dehydropantoate 2-reductase
VKILVYGAGVIGSLYAAKLGHAGHDVAILARGRRLADLKAHGLIVEDAMTAGRLTATVGVVDALGPEDRYDLVLVPVRRDQLQTVLGRLSAARFTPNVLFFCNTAAGPDELVNALGRDRVLLGFPGAGGMRDNAVVRYLLIRQQPTVIGELDGSISPRLRRFHAAFERAGFPTVISRHMDGWLRYHAVFVCSICGAIYEADGSASRLADRPEILRVMVQATREGFAALHRQGITGAPGNLRMLYEVMPCWFAVRYWRRRARQRRARGVRPARAAGEGISETVGLGDAFP